jgi:hypothetical protein
MTMQRSLAILSFAATATSGAACGTIGSDSMPRSCKALLDSTPALDNGAYTLHTARGAPYQAYCDMENDSGGWTLVLKVDGGAANSQFGYNNSLWTSSLTLQDDKADTNRVEAKFRSFTEVAFSRIRVVMVETQPVALTLEVTGESLMSLMRGPFVQVDKPRQEWLSLVPGAVVQPNCNTGGVNNSRVDPFFRVRIGMLANEQVNCTSPDSFVGVGGGGGVGNGCNPGPSPGIAFVPPSAGSISGGVCNPTPGPNHVAFAYVYVR